MNEQEVKQVQDLVTGQLDGLKALVNNTCKQYETKQVPLGLIERSVKMAKIDPKTQKIRSLRKFFKAFNGTLDTVEKLCKENAKGMNTDNVPVSVFNLFLDKLKSEFIKSIGHKHSF